MGAPYPRRAVLFYALMALAVAFIAVYRAELYQLPASALALSAVVGLLGLIAPLILSARTRFRLFTGTWPLVIVAPFVGFLLSPRLLPSAVMVGPFFFAAGAALTMCVVVLWNLVRRERALRRLLEHPDALDAGVASRLETYFAVETPVMKRSSNMWRPVQRALRAQAWVSTRRRRARAAALLRELVEEPEGGDAEPRGSLPTEALRAHAEARNASTERIPAAFLSAAARLEEGGRILRWKSWLRSLLAPALDADRDWYAAVDHLARHHEVSRPAWFRAARRALGGFPLTERDVTPPWNVGARLGKPVTVAVAVVVMASVLLSTATAQTPLEDSRRLPVIAGPSSDSRIEPRLSRVASTLAGRRAEVRCWSREDWGRLGRQRTSWTRGSRSRLGRWSAYASDQKRAHLAPAICAALMRLAYERIPVERDPWPWALAWSVATLSHEAQHIRGISNEARAECYGMQSIAVATRALGRREEEGRYLASLYWRYAYRKQLNPAYMSDECRDGGRLDLRPHIDAWP